MCLSVIFGASSPGNSKKTALVSVGQLSHAPYAAPSVRHSGYKDFRVSREVSGVAFLLFWRGIWGVRAGLWSCGVVPSWGGLGLRSRKRQKVWGKRQKVKVYGSVQLDQPGECAA